MVDHKILINNHYLLLEIYCVARTMWGALCAYFVVLLITLQSKNDYPQFYR